MRTVLVDAGPLVAILDRADPDHGRVRRSPRTTPRSTHHGLAGLHRGHVLTPPIGPAQKALWSRLETEALGLAPLDGTNGPRMRELMEKYRDTPMDLADACESRNATR